MSSCLGQQALVIGAGMSGLAAAGALAKHFEQVTVLERDMLRGDPAHRSGTPQSRQLHGLLSGGLQALCQIFPGLDQDLAAAGAAPIRVAADICEELPGFDPACCCTASSWLCSPSTRLRRMHGSSCRLPRPSQPRRCSMTMSGATRKRGFSTFTWVASVARTSSIACASSRLACAASARSIGAIAFAATTTKTASVATIHGIVDARTTMTTASVVSIQSINFAATMTMTSASVAGTHIIVVATTSRRVLINGPRDRRTLSAALVQSRSRAASR